MRFDRLTHKFQQALSEAQNLALTQNNTTIEPEHILLTMLSESDTSIVSLLKESAIDIIGLKKTLKKSIENFPTVDKIDGDIRISRDLNNLLNLTEKIAADRKDRYIASELFLLALLDSALPISTLIKQFGGQKQVIEKVINKMRQGQPVNDQNAEQQRGALNKYTLDLTERAKQGKLDPVIGRDDEIRRAIQVLQRRTKNNPILIVIGIYGSLLKS